MPCFRTLGISLVLLGAPLFGCGAGERDSGDVAPSSPVPGGSTNPNTPTSLEFQGFSGNLKIAPSDVRTLRVLAQPPGIYRVRFGLLGEPGEASLDRSEAETAPDGTAEVVLTAPDTIRLFRVRASIGTALEANAVISVGEAFATLQVRPSYSGRRPIVYWVASAHDRTTCEDLPVNPPDGDAVDQAIRTDKPGEKQFPTMTDVPTGTKLAVTLRAARYIQGCANVSDLVPDKVNDLVVPVRDVPLQVKNADLDLHLKIDSATANVGAVLDKAETVMFDRLTQGVTSDVGILLDAMAEATEAAQKTGYTTQRTLGLWDTWVSFALGLGASTELRRPLRGWFATARRQILEREMFSARLLTTALSADSAELRLERTFGYDPVTAGFSPADGSRLSVTAEPGDNLVMGGTLVWFPTQLLGRFVTDVAAAAGAGAASTPEALASALSCDRVARELIDHGSDSTHAFPGCDLACATKLCTTALQSLWGRMIEVTESDQASLVLSATGVANVDDHANVASVDDGAWSANVDFASVSGKLAGDLSVTGVRPPPTQ